MARVIPVKNSENCTRFRGGGILAFLDSHKSGTLDGTPIYRIDEAPAELREYDVLITIHNRDVDLKSIETLICSHGWKPEQIKTLPQFYAEAQSEGIQLPELYWLAQMDWPKYEARIQEAETLFQDEKSLALWHAILEYRQTAQMPDLLRQIDSDIYHPDFLQGIHDLSFVDGGAYDGDTIEDFVKHGITFQNVFCFEPDYDNLELMKKRFHEMESQFYITIFPLGLNSKFETLTFESERGEGSAISENGNVTIQTAALDDLLFNQSVSYIKMDIEGSEIAALIGCKNLIQSFHPILAISVYHRPEHLWEIPLLIKNLNPDYTFYLRQHGMNGFDTVCYAIDKRTLGELKK